MGDLGDEERLWKLTKALGKKQLRGNLIELSKFINDDCIIRNKLFNLRTLKKAHSYNIKLEQKQINLKGSL